MNYPEARSILLSVKERIQRIRGFYTHLAAFIGVHGLLFYASPDPAIPFLTLIPWGCGLIYQGLQVFGWKGKSSREWELNFVREVMGEDFLPGDSDDINTLSDRELKVLKKRLEVVEAIIVNADEDIVRNQEQLVLKNPDLNPEKKPELTE